VTGRDVARVKKLGGPEREMEQLPGTIRNGLTVKLSMKKALAGTILFLAFACAPVAVLRQSSGTVRYFYDDLGRLVQVVDPSGNIATYNYDAVGNLLSITSSTAPSSNGLAIFNFNPQQGPIGTAVFATGILEFYCGEIPKQ
jgi:YD repeat-containing protein